MDKHEWYLEHREKLLEYQKKYREEHKEHIKQVQKEWNEKNKDKIRKAQAKYNEKVRKQKPPKEKKPKVEKVIVKKPKKYLNNDNLHIELVKSMQQNEITPELGKMMVAIADGVIRKMKYNCNMDRDDCYQTGLELMITNYKCYDPNRTTAFSYMTEIFKRGMARGYNELIQRKQMFVIGSKENGGKPQTEMIKLRVVSYSEYL